MSRQVVPTLKCDGCETILQVADVKDLPPGWYQVTVGSHHKPTDKDKFDFCGLECVALWAQERAEALPSLALVAE
jgi:hypothetical protein